MGTHGSDVFNANKNFTPFWVAFDCNYTSLQPPGVQIQAIALEKVALSLKARNLDFSGNIWIGTHTFFIHSCGVPRNIRLSPSVPRKCTATSLPSKLNSPKSVSFWDCPVLWSFHCYYGVVHWMTTSCLARFHPLTETVPNKLQAAQCSFLWTYWLIDEFVNLFIQ